MLRYMLNVLLQAFVQLVTQHVDTLEEVVAKAERDLEPSKLRRVLSGSFKFVSWCVCPPACIHTVRYTKSRVLQFQ